MDHLEGVIGQEHQLQRCLRQIRRQIVERRSEKHLHGLMARRTAGGMQKTPHRGEEQRRQTDGRPDERRSRKDGPAEDEQRHRRGSHQAPPQVVEDLPA